MNNQVNRAVRSARLATGLILFAYAASHLFNHALGIRSLWAMEAGSAVLLGPWQTYVGLTALYFSFLLHGCLGLLALLKRQHLRMPASEAFQLATGLAIPLLLIPHAASIRLGYLIQGMEFGYARLLYQFWVISPDFALPRQILLLIVIWFHGCIGLRSWLRTMRWYPRAVPALASLATLVPVLALLGFINAGLDIREAAQHGKLNITVVGTHGGAVDQIVQIILVVYVGGVALILLMRAALKWRAKRFSAVRITYPSGQTVSVPRGFTVLEASRWAGIAHESVCGGRGRCSTCRIRILRGSDTLPGPDELELRALRRIGAAPDIRLACQLKPWGDLAIEPLVRPRTTGEVDAIRFDAAVGGSKEIEITAMFVDLRGSTELATGRLPYDALYLFDRYIQVVSGAIRAHKGYVTSVAGDGVMSVFSTDTEAGPRHSLRSVLDIWKELEKLNVELAADLPVPLKVGIGVHVGSAVVGRISEGASQSLQFLGDTGNVAAKLERYTKTLQCTLVVSEAALLAAGASLSIERTAVKIAGRKELLRIGIVKQRSELERLLADLPST